MTGSFSAAVLAGGESRRMGRDKAFLPADAGRLQWELQCERLERLHPLECLVSANATQTFVRPGIRVVVDAHPHQGPLGGIAACLRTMSLAATHLVVLAVDMPRMRIQLLQELIARAAPGHGAIFQRAGRFEPLAAVYPREALPVAEAALAQGMLKLQDWVTLLIREGRMLALPAPENAEEAFSNINSKQDLVAPLTSADKRRIERFDATSNRRRQVEDAITVEEPLEIRVEGRSVAVVMRTPGDDLDLARGFLLTEGIVEKPEDVFEISQCPSQTEARLPGNVVDVVLTNPGGVDLEALSRHVYTSSSCGLCGRATLEAVFQQFPPVTSDLQVSAELLLTLPERLRAAQKTFAATGGLHASAIFDADGRMLALREDVGRHNALDKIIGHAWQQDWLPLRQCLLLVSGRISFELMQKALCAGLPIVAGISAPSTLAIDCAEAGGQMLVGFLRERSFNLYAHRERLQRS